VAGEKRTRIIIADDHPLYREALATAFGRTADIEASASVDDLEQALAAMGKGPVDLVLLDLDMPGMSGTAGVARVRELHPDTRVAVISGSVGAAKIRDALSAGACGYVPKTFTPDMILAAVRLMLSGAIYVPPDALTEGGEAAPEGRGGAGSGSLTPRELEVLRLLTKGAANKEIARQIGVAEVTVKLHTRRILEKLGVRNRAAAAAIAVKTGLVVDEPAN
jgi:DNA-binding NarL/FixJ family response regulator